MHSAEVIFLMTSREIDPYQFKTYAFLMEDKIAVGAFGHAVNYGCDDPFYYHARQQQKQQQQQIS